MDNLNRLADFHSRLARGRSYVRQGKVVHLEINYGEIYALVQGTRKKPYEVSITIDPIEKANIKKIETLLSENISSIDDLIQGEFPDALKAELLTSDYGFFPARDEVHFDCSCPDWAIMCKHVIAALYGIAVKLDQEPLLFLHLRGLSADKLIRAGVEQKLESLLEIATINPDRVIDDSEIQTLFGI